MIFIQIYNQNQRSPRGNAGAKFPFLIIYVSTWQTGAYSITYNFAKCQKYPTIRISYYLIANGQQQKIQIGEL